MSPGSRARRPGEVQVVEHRRDDPGRVGCHPQRRAPAAVRFAARSRSRGRGADVGGNGGPRAFGGRLGDDRLACDGRSRATGLASSWLAPSGRFQMANHGPDAAGLMKAARIAGLVLLLSLIVPTLNWAFALSRFVTDQSEAETANEILRHEFVFRVGIVGELTTSAIAAVLALSLYVLLQSVGKNLALLGLLLKLVEATLWAVIALGHLAALVALRGASEQARAIVGVLLREQVTLNAVPGLLLGLGSVVFLYALVRSKYVPRVLAGFGVLSYALVFLSNLLAMTSQHHATVGSQMAWGAPSVFSELAIGFCLLIRGARVGGA